VRIYSTGALFDLLRRIKSITAVSVVFRGTNFTQICFFLIAFSPVNNNMKSSAILLEPSRQAVNIHINNINHLLSHTQQSQYSTFTTNNYIFYIEMQTHPNLYCPVSYFLSCTTHLLLLTTWNEWNVKQGTRNCHLSRCHSIYLAY